MTQNDWLSRLKNGLSRTSAHLNEGIAQALKNKNLDESTLDDLEDILITSDMGVSAAAKLRDEVAKAKFEKEPSFKDIKYFLAAKIADILKPVEQPLLIDNSKKPFVILVQGVNGSGKTTTIGKLAKIFTEEGKSVLLAAGDTFRAAAIEQLQIWGDRTGCRVISHTSGADPAGLVFDALGTARRDNIDLVIIDTAGRLQNRDDLMAELHKISRVIRKLDQTAPHCCLLILDATVGQNALSQVEKFQKTSQITGLVMNKLDGSARGGILVSLAEKFKLPVHAIGVGEGEDDLMPFNAEDFAKNLLGLNN
ncbi:MAG: signal recognition particle-docking protein FtsY [Rhodospirillaceae bacterium]|nr:signal recognition particle-docking protein FtsY [Rhodospirillaceae bacterium]|tara:strand:- start:89 stop:1015 length:927 start_codon:yes stop_codon:yes gene_type:complete